jgi:hypothetical protein
MKALISLLFLTSSLTGCATITTGTSQSILVDTTPEGAICRFTRLDKEVGIVNPTPGMLLIDKSIYLLAASCTKEGFYPTSGKIDSHYQPMTMGNVLLGGVVGIVVDAASGAQAVYDKSIIVILKKVQSSGVDKAIDEIRNMQENPSTGTLSKSAGSVGTLKSAMSGSDSHRRASSRPREQDETAGWYPSGTAIQTKQNEDAVFRSRSSGETWHRPAPER